MSHFPFDTSCSNSIPVFKNLNSAEDSALKATLFPNDSSNGSCPFLFRTHEFSCGPNNQKRFLVFDRSGDKTTLIHSSGGRTPVPHPIYQIYQNPTPFVSSKLCNVEFESYVRTNVIDKTDAEMHEDSEELDALLCSDSDDYFSGDVDELSTGHSPSTMTDGNVCDLGKENSEEVDSVSTVPTKRRRLLDGGYQSLLHDTVSLCGNTNKAHQDELGSFSCDVGLRKEQVRKTLRLLQQNVIPYDVKGKDAIVVIDEAIRYLKSLKVEAEAMGIGDV